jgi:hypothetical protein
MWRASIKEMDVNYTKTILVASVAVAALMSAGPAMADDGYVTQVIIDPGNSLGLPAGTYDPAAEGIHAGVTLTPETLASLKGAKGDAGAQGIQGEQGLPGATGEKGEKGDTGAQGAQGNQGNQGFKGDKGEQGIQGATGAQGAAGINGTNGTNGVDGTKGDKGDQGIAGTNGTNGKDGIQGIQGVAGVKGDKGDAGATGAQGVAGVKGDTGSKGDKGDKGDAGAQGAAGVDGKTPNLDKVYANIAATAAIAIPHVDPGKRGALWLGGASTDQAGAVSLNGALRFNDAWQAGVGVSTDTNGKSVVVKGGAGFQF